MTRPDKRAAFCCDGSCNSGRRCPLVVDRISHLSGVPREPVHQRASVPVQMQVFPTPRTRRVRRFLRDLVRLLTSPRFRP